MHCTASRAMTSQPNRVMCPSKTVLNKNDPGRKLYRMSSTASTNAKRPGSMSSGTWSFREIPVTVMEPTEERFVNLT